MSCCEHVVMREKEGMKGVSEVVVVVEWYLQWQYKAAESMRHADVWWSLLNAPCLLHESDATFFVLPWILSVRCLGHTDKPRQADLQVQWWPVRLELTYGGSDNALHTIIVLVVVVGLKIPSMKHRSSCVSRSDACLWYVSCMQSKMYQVNIKLDRGSTLCACCIIDSAEQRNIDVRDDHVESALLRV